MQFETPPPHPTHPDRPMTFVEVLRHHFHPPGYPLIVLAISQPVRAILGTNADSLILSSQIASLLAAILLTFPMYYLGKSLWNRRTAFTATLLFQSLPVWCGITSDGLSDGWFLCLSAFGIWLAATGFQRNSMGPFFLAGLFFGLAYLIRPEGIILFGTCGIMLIRQIIISNQPRTRVLRCGLTLTFGVLLVSMPYILTIGKLTNKPSGNIITNKLAGEDTGPHWEHEPEANRPTTNALFASWRPQGHPSPVRWALERVGAETLKTLNYAFPILMLVGIFLSRKSIREDQAIAYLIVQCLTYLAALLYLAYAMGYISERHTLVIAFLGCYFAAVSIPYFGRLLALIQLTRPKQSPEFFTVISILLLFGTSYPFGFKRHHTTREGHLIAGRWLAEHAKPEDGILDPYFWAEFYATKEFNQDADRLGKLGIQTVYVVAEPNSPRPISHLDYLAAAQQAATHGKIVFTWSKGNPRYDVVIYRWDPKEK